MAAVQRQRHHRGLRIYFHPGKRQTRGAIIAEFKLRFLAVVHALLRHQQRLRFERLFLRLCECKLKMSFLAYFTYQTALFA